MSYFNYSITSHLFRPSNIIADITYGGETSTVPTTTFDGTYINKNFFNLACSALDNTERLLLLEGSFVSGNSTSLGAVAYNGFSEASGKFYGGENLLIEGSAGFVVPYALDSTNQKAFQVAVGDGITYSLGGGINTALSRYRDIIFGTGVGTTYASATLLTTYLNSKLKYSSKDDTNTFIITGTGSPGTYNATQWGESFGTLTANPRSFWIFYDDGYTLYRNDSSNVTKRKVITLSSDIAQSMEDLRAAVSNAIAAQFGTVFTVAVDVNDINLTASSDRTIGGIYQFTLLKDPTETDNGVLDWMGLFVSGTNTSEAYDLTSVMQFTYSGTSPYTINIEGVGSSTSVSFIDKDSGDTIDGLLTEFGLPTTLTEYYHIRTPLATYSVPLNYGGDLKTRDLYVRNINVSGSLLGSFSITGAPTFTGLTLSGAMTSSSTISTSGNVTITGTAGLSVAGDTSLWGDVVIGTSLTDSLNIAASTTFTSPVNLGNAVQAGAINFNGLSGAITASQLSVANATISNGNFTNINTSTLTVSGPISFVLTRAEYTGTSSALPATGTPYNFATKVEDTANAVTAEVVSPFAPWKFTAPSSGVYLVDVYMNLGITGATVGSGYIALDILINDSPTYVKRLCCVYPNVNGTYPVILSGAMAIRITAGNYINIRPVYTAITPGVLDIADRNIPRIGITMIGS